MTRFAIIRSLLPLTIVLTCSPLRVDGQAFLVENIGTGPEPDTSSQPADFRDCGGLTYFTAADGGSARDLWRTDGTTAGTIRLSAVSSPYDQPTPRLHPVRTACVFFPQRMIASELWRTDGTAEGTFPLKLGTVTPDYAPAPVLRDGVLFFASDQCELWRTDGTEDGTRLVARICPVRIRPGFGLHQGQIYFLTEDIFGRSLWASDGTEDGTRPVTQITGPLRDPYVDVPQFFSVGETLLFVEDEDEYLTHLWRTDGSEAGTYVLTDAERPAFATLENGLVFLRNAPEVGVEPWLTDGTGPGTFMLKDINAGPGGSISNDDQWYFPSFFVSNGLLFFAAYDPDHGYEPWRSDGSSEGTYRLRDINPGPGYGIDPDILRWNQFFFSAVGNAVLFPADDGQHGMELWQTDGTNDHTNLLADIFPGSETSYPTKLVATSRGAVFSAANGTFSAPGYFEYGFELWHTDGTNAGTHLLADIRPGPRSSRPSELAPSGDQAIFVANDGTGDEPWLTDGTESGTFLLKDLVVTDASGSPEELLDFDGTLAFSAAHVGTRTLWLSDTRSGETREITAPGHPAGFSDARYLTRVGDGLAFTALGGDGTRTLFLSDEVTATPRAVRSFRDVFRIDAFGDLLLLSADGGNGTATWVSDGTADGTVQLTSRPIGHTDTFAATTTRAYFTTGFGSTLWQTDGTADGTIEILGFGDEGPRINERMVAAGDRLYFVIHGCGVTQLWAVEHVETVAHYVADIGASFCDYYPPPAEMAVVKDTLYIVASSRRDGFDELFRLDGSELVLVRDIEPDSSSSPNQLTPLGTRLYFTAYTAAFGRELWSTDGTEIGTMLVKDIAPGNAGSDPLQLTAINDSLVFSADDGRNGREAWTRCANQTGAASFTDIAPAQASSHPRSFVASGGQLYFAADDRAHGVELWTTPLAPLSSCQTRNDAGGDGCSIDAAHQATPPLSLALIAGLLVCTRLARCRRVSQPRSQPAATSPRAYRPRAGSSSPCGDRDRA